MSRTKSKTGIYQIRNLKNNKIYIGSASQKKGISNRWHTHKSRLNRHIHSNIHLQSAWNKYGADSFIFEVLEECEPKNCIEREQYYLDSILFANCNDKRFNKLGYNMCRVAGSSLGVKLSKVTRKRMSYAKAGSGTHLAKLTELDAIKVFQLIEQGLSNHQIADLFEVDHSNISKMRTGKTWRYINV